MTRPEPEVAAVLAELSREVHGADIGHDARAVVDRAVEVIGPCEHGSLTVREARGVFRTVASTSAVAARADALQYDLGQGPCVDVVTHDEICLLDDVRADVRWPRWSAEIGGMGLRSVLSVRLGAAETGLGALNLYASRPGAFTRDEVDLATAYAAIAGNAMHAVRTVQHLENALHSRHVIGVAQGVLMVRYDLSMERAFALLQRCSSHTNTKLRDVAAHVAAHGRLPDGTVGIAGTDGSEGEP